jgi:ferric-dicitrate binding protein FerR (iron transport regulator)
MTRKEAKELLRKYESGTCTPEEKTLVDSWYLQICRSAEPLAYDPEFAAIGQRIWDNIQGRRRVRWYYYPMAAAIAVLMVVLVHYYGQKTTTQIADIQPGGNRAVLILGNGQKILLDTVKDGQLATVQGVNIRKANGQIVYEVPKDTHNGASGLSINTINTPNGGQYQVILPDGSKVYLNAASSLSYPTWFPKNERKVTLRGEGYFEIAKDASRPFLVESSNQMVRVTGTHFNVSCYSDKQVLTTLAEGKIEISQPAFPQKRTTLKPGDQSIVSPTGIEVKQIDPDDATAWKDGVFVFNETPLKDVCAQLGRWYDVEVDYSMLPDQNLNARISKSLTLKEALMLIEVGTNRKFKIEGRKITLN